MKATVILFLVIAFLGMFFWGSYNNLISLDERADKTWADVESQLQRRADLIPNLTLATRGLLKQELAVVQAAADRFKSAPRGSSEQVDAAGEFQGGFAEFMGRLLVIQETYPELKTDKTVQSLMDELTGTENRVNYVRTEYNEIVRQYNQAVRSFPGNLIAKLFNFERRMPFEAKEGSENPPTVDLEFDNEITPTLAPVTVPAIDAGTSGMLNN